MKYIRANGMLLTKSETQQDRYWYKTMWYELHQEEGILLSAIGDIVKIKSQGANLIDVLDVGDIVYYNFGKGDKQLIGTISIIPYKGTSIKFRSGLLDLDPRYKRQWKIFKVITHEQYMKLSQEVK